MRAERRAAYVLRFDDICPTMNWAVWERVEEVLRETHANPILAVIPDNRDPKLMQGPAVPDFWERVRAWRDRGWTIALHGYQHLYVNALPGLMGITRQSEFAGLPEAEQMRKLAAGLEIMRRETLDPQVWVAPSHSFDQVTVHCLKQVGLSLISDGHSRWPERDRQGMIWVPCQMWNQVEEWGEGVWTVCYHPKAWDEAALRRFAENVRSYQDRLISVGEAVQVYTFSPLPFRLRVDRWQRQWWRRRGRSWDRALERTRRLLPIGRR